MPKSKPINNHPPNTPSIDGPKFGKTRKYHTYTICSTDPDGDDISYSITWGDGLGAKWLGPLPSSVCLQVEHMWFEQGNFNIKVQARDIYESESGWGTLEVKMPKSKPYFNT